MLNPNLPSPAKAHETLHEFIQRERRMRERFLQEPRRRIAIEEADKALEALNVITKHAQLEQYTQTRLFTGYGGPREH